MHLPDFTCGESISLLSSPGLHSQPGGGDQEESDPGSFLKVESIRAPEGLR